MYTSIYEDLESIVIIWIPPDHLGHGIDQQKNTKLPYVCVQCVQVKSIEIIYFS